jgi:menaquinol-cytochrome c reductase iron-sulfur subunit
MATEPDSNSDDQPEDDATPEVAEAQNEESPDGDRREFMVKAGSIVFGGLVVVAPVGAGLTTLISPMLSKSADGLKVLLASIGDLPADGTPKRFDVVAEKTDGWMKYPPKPIGGVFLRKVSDTEVVAFNSSCPHAGCSVGFKTELQSFHCPCHDSMFEIDGARGEVCVSARGLDKLQVDGETLAENGEVWVTFVNYKAGVSEENKAL